MRMYIKNKETNKTIRFDLLDDSSGCRERIFLAAHVAKQCSKYPDNVLIRCSYSPNADRWSIYFEESIKIGLERTESLEIIDSCGFEFTDV